MLDYQFHWRPALADVPLLIAGAGVMLQVTLLTIIVAVPLALALAVMLGGPRAAHVPARAFIEAART